MKAALAALNRDKAAKLLRKVEKPLTVLQAEMDVVLGPDPDPAVPRVLQQSARRKPLPTHLPRETRRIEPEGTCCPDCGGALKPLADSISEQLELISSAFKVIETVHPKLACGRCDHIAQAAITSSASGLKEAFTYLKNNWNALNEFCRNGWVEIDNNLAENALRMVAVGRRNYLFVGSASGGENAAIMYTLMVTCRLNGVDPEAYLRYVISEWSYLFRGLNGKAIAIKLNKSEKTISGQKRSAMKKLNVASTAELVNRFGIANSVDEFKIINIYRILYFVYFMK